MPIIRSRHSFDTQFTQIPNAWVRDPRISLKAKGLLVQLMSHSPGWAVSISSLAQANDCGKDSIRSAVIELEEVGYLIRSQDRTEAGQFSEVLWVTNDPSDNPSSENPTTVNPTPKNNNPKNNRSKEVHPQPSVEEVDSKFDEFWSTYPRKVEKLEARKVFGKLFKRYGDAIVDGARRLAADPNLPPKQYIPYPASWLNAGGWTNEPYPERILSKSELEQKQKREHEERETARQERLRLQRIKDAEEREARERERRENPVPICEHGRVIYICALCPDPDTPDDIPHDGTD